MAEMEGRKPKPCSALAEVIRPRSPYAVFNPNYPTMEIDLSPLLVLLMIRLTDSADDDGIIWDFCESFGLNRRAVAAAVRAFRHASRTLH